MRKPTLEEVKEYFKDAKVIKSCYNNNFVIGDVLVFENQYEAKESSNRNAYHTIWTENLGYAKIIEYKEPTYTITKETVLKYNMKDEFPEVFEVEFEVGEWVFVQRDIRNESPALVKFNGHGVKTYGFRHRNDGWTNSYGMYDSFKNKEYKYRKATDEEVKEALVNEAKKRGFKEGVCINCLYHKTIKILNGGSFLFSCNKLYYKGATIFDNGTWATIIETVTKEEAEKLLNKKIV